MVIVSIHWPVAPQMLQRPEIKLETMSGNNLKRHNDLRLFAKTLYKSAFLGVNSCFQSLKHHAIKASFPVTGRLSTMLPKRKHTWATSADSYAVLMRHSDASLPRDSRPASRASFAGRRSSLNILSEVKEVTTPLQSPTGMYERIEMTDVLKVGETKGKDRSGNTTEPNSESASLRDAEVVSMQASTATTVLSDRDEHVFTFNHLTSTPTQAEVHASQTGAAAEAAFYVDSPGNLIRATDTMAMDGSSKEAEKETEGLGSDTVTPF